MKRTIQGNGDPMANTRKLASRLLLLEPPCKSHLRRRFKKRVKALKQAPFGLLTDSRLAAQRRADGE